MARGLFVVLEGIEGSGKSSQIKLLCDYLTEKKYSVVTTQEPGGTRIGEVIRDVLIDPEHPEFITANWVYLSGSATTEPELEGGERNGHRILPSDSAMARPNGSKRSPRFNEMDYKTELFLYAADRNQHVEEVIAPALKKEKVVICDRFSLSTFAYQGFGRGIPLLEIEEVNKWATGGLEPDLTVILDVPVEVGLKRATKHYTDRIEQEDISFHKKVREGYLQLARGNSDKIKVVGGTKPKEEIHEEIVKIVEKLLKGTAM